VPLDRVAILASIAKTRRALVVHAATQFAGPGAEIVALVQKELSGQLDAPVDRLGAAYAPIPFAADLERALYPNRETIADAIRKLA
jgi:acetoin:2,6-dichlorophenolindophenol oxidoreductase subunit beta